MGICSERNFETIFLRNIDMHIAITFLPGSILKEILLKTYLVMR